VTVLLPVAVGGDIGVYALLRAFHQEYGCRAVVLSAVPTRAVRDSSFIDNVVVPGIDDVETLVAPSNRSARRTQAPPSCS